MSHCILKQKKKTNSYFIHSSSKLFPSLYIPDNNNIQRIRLKMKRKNDKKLQIIKIKLSKDIKISNDLEQTQIHVNFTSMVI